MSVVQGRVAMVDSSEYNDKRSVSERRSQNTLQMRQPSAADATSVAIVRCWPQLAMMKSISGSSSFRDSPMRFARVSRTPMQIAQSMVRACATVRIAARFQRVKCSRSSIVGAALPSNHGDRTRTRRNAKIVQEDDMTLKGFDFRRSAEEAQRVM